VKCNQNFICLFILSSRNTATGQTGQQIFALYDSNDADAHKNVPGGFVDIVVHLRDKIPHNPILRAWFLSQTCKNSNFHIFETTA